MSNEQIQTNYFVVTGGPGSGKSTVLDYISYLGYITKPEVARVHIDVKKSYGISPDQARQDELRFQRNIASEKAVFEQRLVTRYGSQEVIFLDRGYQGDSVAYYVAELERQKVVETHSVLAKLEFGVESKQRYRYRGLFLLAPLTSYENDYARTETEEESLRISELIASAYIHFGYTPIQIPEGPLPSRAKLS